MATDSSTEKEEDGKLIGGVPQLTVRRRFARDGKNAAWSVSSSKPVRRIRTPRRQSRNLLQSEGVQPHLVNVQFQKKVRLQLVVMYVDFKQDESYTPSKITIRAGDGFHNLKREHLVNTFMLQISIASNHLNGRDTHVRQVKVYGPRPNPVPHQPFQFTSREFITYSLCWLLSKLVKQIAKA
ncbi:unnamed protein product [Rhodiola kirilowii]